MDFLPHSFRTCQLCGVWSENDHFYIPKLIYRVVVLYVIIQFAVGQLIELAVMQGTIGEFTELLFTAFTYVAFCFKLLNFISRRDDMCSMLDDFRLPLCQQKSEEEEQIIQKYSNTAAKMFLMFMYLAQPSGVVLLILPFLSSESRYCKLPLKSYEFLDISNLVYYWIEFVFQCFALIYGIFLNVAMDSMAYGFIIMVTGQMEINCYRLMTGAISIRESIEHRVIIQNIILKIQRFFICVTVPLFCFSLITLCASIFRLSQKRIASIDFFSLSSYLACMLYQIFFYCWFGNELQLKNKMVIDAIYNSNWLDYSVKERKNMWFMMLSAQYDSKLSFHGQCGLTLSTFVWIIKTAYSAFNLLQGVELK